MKDVQLVRLDPAIEASLWSDPAFLEAMAEERWAEATRLVHAVTGRTLAANPISVDTLDWGGYFVVDSDTREVVGSCAFKGPPTEDGTVEIAYFTYPEFEGQGYATSMAGKLISLASDNGKAKRIVAHTLPETNASTRVLEKVSMNFVGEVIDPEDGRVWQWEKRVEASQPGAR